MAKKGKAGVVADKSDFNWISAEIIAVPFITVDRQLRLYFSSQARKIVRSNYVMLGYDHANKRIVVGNPEVVRPTNVEPHKLDKRGYTSARPFIRALGLTEADLPLRYEYVGKDYTIDGAFAFELVDDPQAGGDGRL